MSNAGGALGKLRGINRAAAFSRWMGLEVVSVEPRRAEIRMQHRPEATQYTGFLHAGIIAAPLDTLRGYAAATLVGKVLASNISVNCLAPAIGGMGTARGTAGAARTGSAGDLERDNDKIAEPDMTDGAPDFDDARDRFMPEGEWPCEGRSARERFPIEIADRDGGRTDQGGQRSGETRFARLTPANDPGINEG